MRTRQNRLEPKLTDELSARTEPQPGENANTDHKKEQAMRINLSTEALARRPKYERSRTRLQCWQNMPIATEGG